MVGILAALKNPDLNLRISAGGNRWAYWDGDAWMIIERKYGAKKNTILGKVSFDKDMVELLTGVDVATLPSEAQDSIQGYQRGERQRRKDAVIALRFTEWLFPLVK